MRNDSIEQILDTEIKKVFDVNFSHKVVVGVFSSAHTFVKGYGTSSNDLPDEEAIFQIASITKVFTATLLQILVDKGAVNMNTTLEEIFGLKLALSPKVKNITLLELATHTSGLPGVPKKFLNILEDSSRDLKANPYDVFALDDILGYLLTAEDYGTRGKFVYSNYAMGLLGHILEIKTDRTLEELYKEHIFQPLEMKRTFITVPDSMRAGIVQPHAEDGSPTRPWTFKTLAGAGALHSCTTDLLKFIRANVETSSTLSSQLQKTHISQGAKQCGLGWMQATFLDRVFGNKIIWHNGRVEGYASYMSVDVPHKIGVVILSSKSTDVTFLGMMLTRKVRKFLLK